MLGVLNRHAAVGDAGIAPDRHMNRSRRIGSANYRFLGNSPTSATSLDVKPTPQDRFISSWPWFVTGIVKTVSLGDCARFSATSQKRQRA